MFHRLTCLIFWTSIYVDENERPNSSVKTIKMKKTQARHTHEILGEGVRGARKGEKRRDSAHEEQ